MASSAFPADLFEILLRFRRFNIALTCDIVEMFLQIKIKETDRWYMRFLWRKNNELVKYKCNRLVFGINASPFLAQLISKMNAERHMESLPEAAKAILESTYMDDSLISVETKEQ